MDNDEVRRLLAAAGRGRLEELKAYVEAGGDVNVSNDIGFTPLMSAARNYYADIVDYLLSTGADPRAVTSEGRCVLHAAVGATPSLPDRQTRCVRLLLDAGADPNVASDSGGTPLMSAAWFGCTGAVEELLAAGADASRVDSQGRSALDLAIERQRDAVVQRLKQV